MVYGLRPHTIDLFFVAMALNEVGQLFPSRVHTLTQA